MPIYDVDKPETLYVNGVYQCHKVIDCDSGEEVTHVTRVDTEKGELTRYITDESGNVSIMNRSELETETIAGNFRVEPA